MPLDIKLLKSTLDIVAIIKSRGVKLVKKGASYVGLCPFHKESTPSFSVNPATQLWHCFGCGEGGDVFSFVMKQEGIGFFEAVKKLCKRDIQEKDLEQLNSERDAALTPPTVDRPDHVVLDRIVARWMVGLGRTSKAQEYLQARGLWHPDILRALKVGYSTGQLGRMLPGGGKLRGQLARMGILNAKGNEFFYNRIVVPIFDDAGGLVSAYGRSVSTDSEVPHLYLPGPRRGVFNAAGIHSAKAVVLTESVLDALSLIVIGFGNTTASFGVKGFTADLRSALVRNKTQRIYCAYDADPAGDQAADQLAHDLAGHGIEVWRVKLPCKDPNDFVKSGGTQDEMRAILKRARVIPVPGRQAAAPESQAASATPPPTPVSPTDPAPTATAGTGAGVPPQSASGPVPVHTVTLGDRTYQIEAPPEVSPGSLRVALRATRQGRSFVDTLNLYSDRSRAAFVSRLVTAFRGQVTKKTLEEDFFALLDEVEPLTHQAIEPAAPQQVMSATERVAALELLRCPDLIDAILTDLARLGLVGEDDNKLLAYLVATSRQLSRPLSLSVISRASAGKSWLLNVVLDLMPPEDVLRYTRMSPRALFYAEPGRYKNKILFIEEAIGAKDADLGVRSMQSEKRLANLVTMTDPKTGLLKTQETVVEGPLTYITSSVDQLDHETATRSFEMAIDESTHQTARVLARQFHERTLEGLQEKLTADAILARHRNAQRLLEPLLVVNPYAPQLTFPSGTLRTRRECGKYLSLMDALALVHQHQRPVRTFEREGKAYRYVEVTREDVDRANRLMASCLARALSDLTGPAEQLLLAIRDYVTHEAESRGADQLSITFNRREIRERLEWSDHQAVPVLEELTKREYVEAVAGSFGKRYVYTLSPDHRLIVRASQTIEERIVSLGLKPASDLVDPSTFRSGSDLAQKR